MTSLHLNIWTTKLMQQFSIEPNLFSIPSFLFFVKVVLTIDVNPCHQPSGVNDGHCSAPHYSIKDPLVINLASIMTACSDTDKSHLPVNGGAESGLLSGLNDGCGSTREIYNKNVGLDVG